MKKLALLFLFLLSLTALACGSTQQPCDQLSVICARCTDSGTKVGCEATVKLGNQDACNGAIGVRTQECP
ncbi:MAG: hypothetical protein EP343_31030 [Deltaproteobacteria bacterium]|nr:MAG: hypothetical protein EP343_31030 [Deltaproteobacteria bacterium]